MKSIRSTLTALLMVSIFIPILIPVVAEEKVKSDEKIQSKQVTGELVAVSKQGISVEYSSTPQESYEIFLPITHQTRLKQMKTFSDLQVGDKVMVDYEQTYQENKKGERIILKTVATRISLVKKSTQQALVSKEEESTE